MHELLKPTVVAVEPLVAPGIYVFEKV